jgi:membrane protease YdiL (CAAX protease family)
LLFALGHLPAAHVLDGHLTANIVTYIIIGNTLPGIIFGFLYKQYGLEAAMIAHASAHLIKELGLLLGG